MQLFKRKTSKAAGVAIIGFGAAGIGCIEYMQRLGINDIKYIKVSSEQTAFIKSADEFARKLYEKVSSSEKCFVIFQLGKETDYSFLKSLKGSVIYAVMPSELEYFKHRRAAAKTVNRFRRIGKVKVLSLNKVVSERFKSYPLKNLQELYISAPICADILEAL